MKRVSGLSVVLGLTMCAFAATPAAAQAATDTAKTYFEFEVQHPARIITANAPTYPAEQREARVQGEVLAQFVVGTDSLPVMRTFRILRSNHANFSEAVRAAVPGYRFAPALIDGKPVRQLVQMPFVFSLTK